MLKLIKKLHLLLFILVFAVALSGCEPTTPVECDADQELLDGECVDIANEFAPEILGVEDISIIVGDTFDNTTGVTATDTEDGDLTSSITVTGTVDTTTAGTYDLTYSVTDSGDKTTTETSVVTVLAPNEFPVILGIDEISIFKGDVPDLLLGVTATDAEDGDLTADITYSGYINSNAAGTYVVTYKVTDSAGDKTTETRNVIVVIPNSLPTFLGLSDKEIYQGTAFDPLLGVYANDLEDGDLKADISVTGTVDVDTIGVYELTYAVTDSDLETVTVTRTITVVMVPDNVAPELIGVEDVVVTEGEAFDALEGITATDDIDGDITANIVVVGTVDMNTLGIYTVTLTITDAAGNTTSETFDVEVIEIELSGEEKADLDLALLDLVIEDGRIALPFTGPNYTRYYWSTNNNMVISNAGYIIPPHVGSEAVTVTLSAFVVNGTYTTNASFDFTIQPFEEVEVTSMIILTFEGTSEDYVVESDPDVEIFFVDNGTVPYIDIETFIDMIDGALESDIITYEPVGDDVLIVEYEESWEDFDGQIVTETYTAIIDFTANTFTVDNYDYFSNYIASNAGNYGEGLEYVDVDYTEGHSVTIPLGEYNFDIITYDAAGDIQYLMPVAIADLIFGNSVYYNVYYNGDKLWGTGTVPIFYGDEDLEDMIRTSSFNTLDAEEDMKMATYNYMALAFDYFYGLKEEKGIETFYEIFAPQAEAIITGTDHNVYNRLFDFANALDDGHTSYGMSGYFVDPGANLTKSYSDLGPNTKARNDLLWDMNDLLIAKWGSIEDMPTHVIVDDGKTAIVYVNGFEIDTPDKFKVTMDSLPVTVENVVIDLSNNGGGFMGSVYRIFGYMTEETFMSHDLHAGDGSTITWYIESDYVAYDYNWYILTSGVSFSASNSMASIAQEQGIATIIGQKTGGGACAVGQITTPMGAVIFVSSQSQSATRTGNEIDGYVYTTIEYGVDVDIFISNVTNDQQIIDTINNHQAGN